MNNTTIIRLHKRHTLKRRSENLGGGTKKVKITIPFYKRVLSTTLFSLLLINPVFVVYAAEDEIAPVDTPEPVAETVPEPEPEPEVAPPVEVVVEDAVPEDEVQDVAQESPGEEEVTDTTENVATPEVEEVTLQEEVLDETSTQLPMADQEEEGVAHQDETESATTTDVEVRNVVDVTASTTTEHTENDEDASTSTSTENVLNAEDEMASSTDDGVLDSANTNSTSSEEVLDAAPASTTPEVVTNEGDAVATSTVATSTEEVTGGDSGAPLEDETATSTSSEHEANTGGGSGGGGEAPTEQAGATTTDIVTDVEHTNASTTATSTTSQTDTQNENPNSDTETGSAGENGDDDVADGVASPDVTPTQTQEGQNTVTPTEVSTSTTRDATLSEGTNSFSFGDSECILISDDEFYCVRTGGATASSSTDMSAKRVYVDSEEGGDKEIFFNDGTQVIQITDNWYDDSEPFYDEASATIVWQGLIQDRYQIFSFNTVTGATKQITFTSFNNTQPHKTGSVYVWQGWVDDNWEIFMYEEGSENETVQITTNTWHDMFPQIHNRFITWQSLASDTWNVYVYDIDTKVVTRVGESDGVYENPRFVLLFDNKKENGDVITVGLDPETGTTIPLGSRPAPLLPVENIPEAPTQEEDAALTSTSTQKTGREDTELDGGTGDGPDPVDDTKDNTNTAATSSQALAATSTSDFTLDLATTTSDGVAQETSTTDVVFSATTTDDGVHVAEAATTTATSSDEVAGTSPTVSAPDNQMPAEIFVDGVSTSTTESIEVNETASTTDGILDLRTESSSSTNATSTLDLRE